MNRHIKVNLDVPYIALSVVAGECGKTESALSRFLLSKNIKMRKKSEKISLPDFMKTIRPGVVHSKSIAVWPGSGYSAIMGNFQDGWNSLCNVVTADLITHGMTIYTGVKDSGFPVCAFSYVKNGSTLRKVGRSLDKGRWQFSVQGEAIYGEYEKNYNKRLVVDRISTEEVFSIAGSNGFDLSCLNRESYLYLTEYEDG